MSEKRWRRIRMWTLSQRVEVSGRRRWRWVLWRQPGHAERLALMTPLHSRLGLLEVRAGRGGPWVRPMARAGGVQ